MSERGKQQTCWLLLSAFKKRLRLGSKRRKDMKKNRNIKCKSSNIKES